MLDLAVHDSDDYMPLDRIAARQGLSKKYLESILKLLVQNGLVKGVRGKGGGYRLLRDAADCTVGEILESAGESLAVVACLEDGAQPCERKASCRTFPMWERFDRMAHDFFFGVTLADLLRDDSTEGAKTALSPSA